MWCLLVPLWCSNNTLQLPPNGEWWLYVANVAIGYWMNEHFTPGQLRDQPATEIQWGGEVASMMPGVMWPMGNGRFGSEGTSPVCDYVTNCPAYHASCTYFLPNADGSALMEMYNIKPSLKISAPRMYDGFYITDIPEQGGFAKGTWLFYGGPAHMGCCQGDPPT